MRHMTLASISRRVLVAGTVMVIAVAATPGVVSAADAPPYVSAGLGEIPNAVAVSDTGAIAASLHDAQAVALVDSDGTVRQVPLQCSPADVAISPDGATAWAVCQEDVHVHVIDAESLEVKKASLEVSGLDDIVYLPDVDRLVIGSIQGHVLAVQDISSGDYFVYLRTTTQDVAPGVGVTQLAPRSDASGAYAITDGGDLLYVDLEFGGQVALIADGSPQRFFNSIAMGPFDTALYAAVVDYSTADITNTVEAIDMATGRARQSVLVELDGPEYTTTEVASTYRGLFVAFGQYAVTPGGRTGMLTIPVSDQGVLGAVESALVAQDPASAVSRSGDGRRVAFGTVNAEAIGLRVDGDPYPAAIRITAKATASKLRITGTTTSMRPLTALTVYVKDLTKKKARFVKQKKVMLLNYHGDITWNGEAPSKKFALYVKGGGATSKTITVKRG